MADLRYVVVSDLHLGAAYSLLTHVDEQGKVVPGAPSVALVALGKVLRGTLAPLAGVRPPTLVLMGDVVDLGLSPSGQVARCFLEFIDVLFPVGQPWAFSTQLICLPGNHDHHLWRMAQDEQFIAHLRGNANKAFVPDPITSTQLFEPPTIPCSFLTELMRARPHLADARVNIAYPNLGLLDGQGKRCVVLHHGHYIDSMYRAMSRLDSWLSGTSNPPKTIAQIERQNGPWVDFLWSDLGNAGAVGRQATTLYETLLDAGASHSFAQTIADRLLADMGKAFGVQGDTEITHGITVAGVVRALVDLTAGRAADSQRDGYRTVLSADEVKDLRWYIGGPLMEQIRVAGKVRQVKELSFIFGHTHKPFQDQIAIEPFAAPVAIYNTGGWVMDQPTMMACQGGAAMLIDDALNVASLRLFNDPVNDVMAPVQAAGVGGFRDEDNPLLANLNVALRDNANGWAAFSAATRQAMDKRAHLMLDKFFDVGTRHGQTPDAAAPGSPE